MLTDNDKKRLRTGIYEIYDGWSHERAKNKNPTVYQVYQEKDIWKAKSPSGEVYILDIPQGLPDSSRMPKGKINVSELTRVSIKEACKYIQNMKEHIPELKQKINLLEEAVK